MSAELIDLYAQVLDLLVADAPRQEVLDTIALAIEELIPGSLAAVLTLDRAEDVLRVGAGPSLPLRWIEFIDPWPIAPGVGSCGDAAHTMRRVVTADVTEDPRWDGFREFGLECGLRACWSTPIIGGQDELLGTFAIYHDRPHSPSDGELALVDRCTHLAAIAIEHARLFGALSESEDRFRRAFESNAVGMALVDLDGRFVRVNPALCEMLGAGERELLTRDFRTLVHADQGTEGDGWARRGDGTRFPVTFTASGLQAADGFPVGSCISVLDMTHRHAAIVAEVAQQTAESASRAKSAFLSAMSHELRTPLTALLGFATLLDTLEPDRRATAINRIQEAAGHVVSILDDVLDIAAIEASALTFDAEPVALDLLARDVLELVGPLAAERDVVLTLTTGAPPVTVAADSRRARQVLLNLVSNAIKYNRVGGEVRVEVSRRQSQGSVRVVDTGPGIAPELLGRVFVPFDRLGAERSGVPGSGLGLSLSLALAEAMDGELAVESTVGEGTTTELRLPLACRARPSSGAARSGGDAAGVEVRKDVRGIVLHVEDDPVCRDLVAELFRRRPAVHLVGAATGAEGLRAAGRLAPDLILLDLDLPDMTGEEFVAALAAPGRIAVVSGRAAPALDVPTFRKPIVLIDLLAHVDACLPSRLNNC